MTAMLKNRNTNNWVFQFKCYTSLLSSLVFISLPCYGWPTRRENGELLKSCHSLQLLWRRVLRGLIWPFVSGGGFVWFCSLTNLYYILKRLQDLENVNDFNEPIQNDSRNLFGSNSFLHVKWFTSFQLPGKWLVFVPCSTKRWMKRR